MFALLAALAAPAGADPIRWRLLSDNAGHSGPALHTGVSYTWESAPTNPADTTGRRLLDGDLVPDWNSTTGWNNRDNAVVLDFQRSYRFAKVRLWFQQALPAHVEMFTADKVAEKPEETRWTAVGRIEPAVEGWNEKVLDALPAGRYLRVFAKMNSWGVYFREAQVIGMPVGPDRPALPPVKRLGGALVLAQGGKPFCAVVADEQGSQQAITAAWQLRDTLAQMAGADIPILDVREAPAGARLVVGSNGLSRRLKISVPQQYPGAERFVLKRVGADVVLAGNEAGPYRGTEHAVVEFLRRLGCIRFGEDPLWHSVPRRETVTLGPLDVESAPAIAMRHIWIVPPSVGRTWALGGDSVQSGHNLSAMFPPKEYFARHPEYYPLLGGKRVAEGEAQICTTNADVVRLSAEKAAAAFDRDPNLAAFSLTNNDCGGFCECPECAKARAGAGNPNANAMLRYANAVARALRQARPAARVCFLAYWYALGAPDPAIKAEPGVVVMVVDEGCKAHALDDAACARNAGWRKNFQAWATSGAEMAIYEWYIPGCSDKRWLNLPWVQGDAAVRNVRWWAAHGVQWVTYESQASFSRALPSAWPLYYVAARALWDPRLDAGVILSEACSALYGPAGASMLAYYRTLERALSAGKEHAGIWNLPDPRKVYPPAVRTACRRHLTEALAKAAAAGRPENWQRVAHEVKEWSVAERTLGQ